MTVFFVAVEMFFPYFPLYNRKRGVIKNQILTVYSQTSGTIQQFNETGYHAGKKKGREIILLWKKKNSIFSEIC